MPARTLEQLLAVKDPAWPVVEHWIAQGQNSVEVLPANLVTRADVLVQSQLSTRSPVGAIVYETGGILVDDGWIRLLGSGHPRLPRSLPAWNKTCRERDPAGGRGYVLVADDVIGSFFAIDTGGLGPGQQWVYRFAPDTLQWETTHPTFGDFLHWCFDADLDTFYQAFRWQGWDEETPLLAGSRALALEPPPYALTGIDPDDAVRRAVPIEELFDDYFVRRGQPSSPASNASQDEEANPFGL